MTNIVLLTFDGFNEIDSMVALNILGRVKRPGWQVRLASVNPSITSMNGVQVQAQCGLEALAEADAVLLGSGTRTREWVADAALMARLQLDPARQLVGAQCSGALMLAKLGLLAGAPACTDLRTKAWVIEAGVDVLNQPFHAQGNVASAGGCLSAAYLAAWVICRLAGVDAARPALLAVAPVGEQPPLPDRVLDFLAPYLVGRPQPA